MQQTDAIYQPAMRTLLEEFSTYDVSMMVGDYLRKVLLSVYAKTESRDADMRIERVLALRLLARNVLIGNRFACMFINELRGQPVSPVRSVNLLRLSRRMYANTSDEAAALERILQKENADFEMKSSAFDAMRYAYCLEGALHDAIELAPIEKDMIFRGWAGLFAETLRESYIKYIQVLLGGSEVVSHNRQDFVDTMPFSIESRTGPKPNVRQGQQAHAVQAG
jgi:hypothetical protein